MADTIQKARKSRPPIFGIRPRGGVSMPCPKCGSDSRVLQTRRQGQDEHLQIVRNRECKEGHRFKTTEFVDADE